jgi:hypothetical protein
MIVVALLAVAVLGGCGAGAQHPPAGESTRTPTAAVTITGRAPAALATAAPAVSGPLVLDGAHDLIFYGVTFRGAGSGWGDASAVIYIQGATHDITFKDCTVETNQDGAGNGVKIVDTGKELHDITFDRCTFKYQPRMAFECIGREKPGATGYQRVDIKNCTFEASAGEAISYDDGHGGTAGDCVVSGNTVKGAGVGTRYRYGQVFEINGTRNMTVRDNFFGAGRDGIMNLQGRDSRPVHWTFSGNVIDGTSVVDGVQPHNQLFACTNVRGGATFSDRIVNGAAYATGEWGYFRNCDGMDFSASTVSGAQRVPSTSYRRQCTNMHWPK